MSTTLHVRHPGPIELSLDRLGRQCHLPLPSRDQMRRAIALDPAEDGAEESREALDERRARQLAIFAEGSDLPVGQLTADEEVQILHAICAIHWGYDPALAVSWQQTLKKKAQLVAAMELLEGLLASTPTPSNSPQG